MAWNVRQRHVQLIRSHATGRCTWARRNECREKGGRRTCVSTRARKYRLRALDFLWESTLDLVSVRLRLYLFQQGNR